MSQQTKDQDPQSGGGTQTQEATRDVREPSRSVMPDDNNIPLGGSTALIGADEAEDAEDGVPVAPR